MVTGAELEDEWRYEGYKVTGSEAPTHLKWGSYSTRDGCEITRSGE